MAYLFSICVLLTLWVLPSWACVCTETRFSGCTQQNTDVVITVPANTYVSVSSITCASDQVVDVNEFMVSITGRGSVAGASRFEIHTTTNGLSDTIFEFTHRASIACFHRSARQTTLRSMVVKIKCTHSVSDVCTVQGSFLLRCVPPSMPTLSPPSATVSAPTLSAVSIGTPTSANDQTSTIAALLLPLLLLLFRFRFLFMPT